MKAFKPYDIRGIYNKDFDKEDVYKIGFFIPQVLKTKKVLIGNDARESSAEILEYLSKGIMDAGADVHYLGLSTTPMLYYSTAEFNFEASVMITASHNSKQYNGLKVSGKDAKPIGYDNGLKEIETLINTCKIEISKDRGSFNKLDVKDKYLAYLKKYIPEFSNLKISLDCSNGMAGLFIKELLGNKIDYINYEIDCSFPNHEPNPLVAKNVVQLQEKVRENKSDLGVIFDGDADRVMFVDENSTFISPDLMIAVLAHYFLEEKGLKGKVIQDIRTSKAVGEYISKFGSSMEMWRVGRAYAATKLKEIDGLYGGELAGHYYFKDFYYSDSGILACLLIIGVLSKMKTKGISVSQLISEIKKYENSGEINYKIENKQAAMDAIVKHFKSIEEPEAFYDFDGYRMDYKDWWLNVRQSNTEPLLRFIAEAKNKTLLDEILKQSEEIIISLGGKREE